MKLIIILTSLLFACSQSDGLNIFAIFPLGTYSHFTVGDAILKALWRAGHKITVVSPFPQKTPLENYRDISTVDTLEVFQNDKLSDGFLFRHFSPYKVMNFLYTLGELEVDTYMTHPKVRGLMDSGEKFDICLFENFNTEALFGLVDHFNCTLITYTTFPAVTWVDEMTSNRSPMSYVPHPWRPFIEKMNFYERMINFVTFMAEEYFYHVRHLPVQRRQFEKYFPNSPRTFDEIYKSSAIIFSNIHVTASSARPYLPNIIEIGGIHVEEAKALPDKMQKFIDDAEDGVILFSMGSVIQAHKWPVDKREALIKTFSKLKQKVIWKYENETLTNKPDNVMISPWIPQRDILAHPNVKIFITHGGYLGTTEATYEGVPTLGIAVYADQMMNMNKVESRGCGLQVIYEEISEEKLTKAINELLNNPKYRNNAKEVAARFKDRPMTPQEAVVYWTEYVYRNQGASYLRAAGNDLNFIQFYLIDVLTVFVLGAILIILLIYLSGKFLINKFNGKSLEKKKTN